MNNDKTEFRIIASKLEELLREYKNTYPKSFGQILNLDIPVIALLAVAVVIFSVIPLVFFNYSFLCIFILSIPFLYSRYKGSEMRKVLEERRHYLEIQSKLRAKIRSLKADRYSKYPDVRIYLKKYKNELKDVERHKQKILDFYHLFIAGIIALFIGGIVLIYKYQPNIKDTNPIVKILPSKDKYIATIKPLATNNNYYMKHLGKKNITLKYDTEYSVLYTSFDHSDIAGHPQLRLMITDTFGHPISGIPIFYFRLDYHSFLSISVSMVDDADKCDYEINRRLDFLHKYGSNFRYVIEEYESTFSPSSY